MKLLVSLIVIALITGIVYFCSSKIIRQNKKQKHRIKKWKPVMLSVVVAVFLLAFLTFQMYKSATAPDTQCMTVHIATVNPPSSLTSAMDYFLQGNYDYDIGNCKKAIIDYTKSIQLNPHYPEAYNNRAYTYMRVQNYKDALSDLDKALALNPNYVQALMNRGDIHNYYMVDRQSAIIDYQKVISLNATHGTSVCGHLFLAKHNGWNVGTVLDIPRELISNCN